MRHKKQGRKFHRAWEHRKSMFHNLARSLVTHGRIKTTVAKAKELRGLAEGLVTLALRNDLHARRQAFRVLNSHQLVQKLFEEIGPRFAGVPSGGYTRVVKLALPRPGDSAALAFIEFTRLPGEETQAKPVKKAAQAQPAAQESITPEAPAEVADASTPEPEAKEEDSARS